MTLGLLSLWGHANFLDESKNLLKTNNFFSSLNVETRKGFHILLDNHTNKTIRIDMSNNLSFEIHPHQSGSYTLTSGQEEDSTESFTWELLNIQATEGWFGSESCILKDITAPYPLTSQNLLFSENGFISKDKILHLNAEVDSKGHCVVRKKTHIDWGIEIASG